MGVQSIALAQDGHELVRSFHVVGRLREHHDVLARARQHRVHNGHAVAGAAVQQQLAVDVHDLADQRHGRRRDEVGQVGQRVGEGVVVRLAGDEVAGNGDQLHGRLVEPGVVERLQAVGDLVEGSSSWTDNASRRSTSC